MSMTYSKLTGYVAHIVQLTICSMLGVYDGHLLLDQLQLTFSGLKQVILDQTRQNGYQTVPFSVYIHNLMFVFIFE